MRYGLLYAMEKEAAGLLQKLDAKPLEPMAGISFYSLPGGHILCIGGVGKVNAAMATQILIGRFQVDAVLNAGCAGAFSDLPAGTIVVAETCVQHDVDTTLAGDPPGLVSTVNCVEFPCAEPAEMRARLETLGYPVICGTVATGDWFGRDFRRAAAIRARYGAAVCDMEACAAAQVCLRNGISFQALKVVSDHLFAEKQNEEYETNVAAAMETLNAAVYAYLTGMED